MSVSLADGFGLGERGEEAWLLVLLTSRCRLLAADPGSLGLTKRQAASGGKVKSLS